MPLRKITLSRAAILYFVLGVAAYANSVTRAFLWDDQYFIRDNVTIRGLTHLPRLFLEHIGSGGGQAYVYYRPLQELSYMADYAVWGLDARGYHVTNILLHIAAGLAVFGFIRLLTGRAGLALASGALFLLHPVNTEAVSYLSGRGEPLSLIFMLSAFIFYLRDDRSPAAANLWAVGLFSLAAFFTKENTVVLPALLVCWHFFYRRPFRLRRFAPVPAGLLAYALFRLCFVRASGPMAANLAGGWARVPGFFNALLHYLRVLVFPFGLHFDYGQRLFAWGDWSVPAGLALTAALVVSALRLRRRYPLFGFSVAWFLIALLPYSNIYLLFNYKADHNLYVPLVVLSALGAAALLKAGRRLGDPHRQSWPVIAAGLYFCGLTVAQNAYWRDPVVFYRRTLALNPRSWSSCLNLGNEYASRGRPRRAIDLYQRALRLRPGDPLVLRDLGLAFRDTGDLPRAEQALKEALARDPASARAHDDLGLVFRTAGRLDRAAGEFRESVRLDPRFVGGYVNLGAAYFEMGRYPEAEAALRRALALDRTDAGAWYHLGLVAIKAKKYAVARTCFRNAAAGPAGKKKKALFHLAAVDLRLGRAKEAAAVMARAFPSREERQFRDAELKQAVGEMQ